MEPIQGKIESQQDAFRPNSMPNFNVNAFSSGMAISNLLSRRGCCLSGIEGLHVCVVVDKIRLTRNIISQYRAFCRASRIMRYFEAARLWVFSALESSMAGIVGAEHDRKERRLVQTTPYCTAAVNVELPRFCHEPCSRWPSINIRI